ncbi:hypothetical protein DVK02_05250 [Halobellus sp. Atlit-31R]|nr:hypothetical protein DVK02_05250 [Halobellus sp. Atlit-31R]
MSSDHQPITRTATRPQVFDRYDRALSRLYHLEASNAFGCDAAPYESIDAELPSIVDRCRRSVDVFAQKAFETESYPGEAFDRLCGTETTSGLYEFVSRAEIDPSDVVLLRGTTAAVESRVFHRLFEAMTDIGVIVSTAQPGHHVVDTVAVGDLTVVDCTPTMSTEHDDDRVRSLPNASNLTAVGTKIVGGIQDCDGSTPPLLGVQSLYDLGIHNSPQAVSRFLQVVISKLRGWGVGGVMVGGPDGESSDAALEYHFDYVVDVRPTPGGGIEARVRGKAATPATWHTLWKD